jgi:hypothetical protein
MEPKVEVKGLAEFSRGLRKLDSEAPKQLRVGLNSAAELLIGKTRPLIPSRTGAARASLKARSTRTSARIAVGGRKAGYYPWLDFGGQGRHKGRPAKREFIKGGRYLYPTLGKVRPQILDQLDAAIRTVARDAGLEVE